MKKLCVSIIMGLMATLLIAVPALGMYYAYIYIKESAGNSYTSLPLMVSANVSQLVAGKYITSTGLDTRVLTGDGYSSPHMLTNDKILFVSDLGAYEDKTLIFYTGASALSGFPVIVGQGGNITTDDDASMEPGWVKEFLVSGYFDTSAGSDKNIAYKEDAYRAWISGEDTLRVAALEAGGGEQWALSHSPFTTGTHTVYVVTNGLGGSLYVDDMDVAKDTTNLFDTNTVQTHGSDIVGASYNRARCFYAAGRYWIIYYYDTTSFRYITSTDGNSWGSAVSINISDIAGGEELYATNSWDVKFRDGYMHITYASDYADGSDRLMYRRGAPQSDGTISWSAAWQTVMTYGTTSGYAFMRPYIAIDSDGYPTVLFTWMKNWNTRQYIQGSSANNGTWGVTAEWEMFGIRHTILNIMHFPNSNELAVIALERDSGGTYQDTYFRYYDGAAWQAQETISSYVGQFTVSDFNSGSMTADSDGNLYVGWGGSTHYLAIRYASGVWQRVTLGTVSDSVYRGVRVCYNETNGLVYILYSMTGTPNYVVGVVLNPHTMTLGTPVIITTLLGYRIASAPAYSEQIGFLMVSTNTYHTYVDLSQYVWNDNPNDWHWMQNDVMPYADYLMWGVDGELVMKYQPNTIVQGTTLPDRSTAGSNNPGTINWGSNPDGVDVSISGLLTDETESQYDYAPYIDLGGEDIIKPEPTTLTGDIDMTKLERNPFRPLALAIAEVGDFSERLAWLGMGWLALIIAMLLVHLGWESRPGEQPQHFILTALTGLGLSIIFYVTGAFPLWPVIVLAFGFVASIVYERMPTL